MIIFFKYKYFKTLRFFRIIKLFNKYIIFNLRKTIKIRMLIILNNN